jgi:predicted MPP superfamily phosphohydrolase
MSKSRGLGFVFLILIFAIIEYYAFTAIRFSIRNVKNPYKTSILVTYIAITLLWFLSIAMFPVLRTMDMSKAMRNFLVSFSMGILITKILIAIILLIDDLRRGTTHLLSLFYNKETMPLVLEKGMSRSEFINKFALLFGGTIFGTMLYGMSNRYNYTIKNISLSFANLPKAFKGMKIVQISDIHSGSLSDLTAVAKGIEKINAINADAIFFTGDLVNNKSDEAEDFIPIFSKLKAKHGVFSILGNHDYGDYVEWESKAHKKANLERLKEIHKENGWRLLLDEHIVLEQEGEKIALIGVENTSFKNRFQTYGSLEKAYKGSEMHPFKILLSHDPSHWDGEINSKYKDIDLTLSGHTHGFQFGIDIPWLKWSPVQYVYKQWAGLYQKDNQHLYVNRGFGFLGYPGRVGIMPEITVIELV